MEKINQKKRKMIKLGNKESNKEEKKGDFLRSLVNRGFRMSTIQETEEQSIHTGAEVQGYGEGDGWEGGEGRERKGERKGEGGRKSLTISVFCWRI